MRWIALPLVCAVIAGVAATAATARMDARSSLPTATTGPTAPLATGLVGREFQGSERTTADAMAAAAGVSYIRLMVPWAAIAPKTLPASGFDPTDPTSPYYDWGGLDATVSSVQAAGLTPILDIVRTPDWAYKVLPGTWSGGSPNLAQLRAFATAIARHYDGSGPTAAVHAFSVWNEANFTKNLYPQSPAYYRSMVNAVADGVHGVDRSDLVIAGELAPFRHTKTTKDRNNTIPPMTFMRAMLCISNTTPAKRTCAAQARFDVWAHHPYSDTGPYGKAKSTGGVELGDLPKMGALLQTAEQLGAIASAQPVQFWVTEFGWSSNLPNKHGVPMDLEARWVPESMYQMWQSGVTVGFWYLLEDRPAQTPFQSGLYFRSSPLADAKAKPLLTPFTFPFVAYLKPHGKVFIWGRDATSDTQNVAIQRQTRRGGKWTTVATITSNSDGIFTATLALGATYLDSLRASAPGSGTSRGFALTVPRNENMDVTPFPNGG
ncbi:MAG TPA: carboxypeptidase-like regulatory domain-containing protein [Gaiellaceae bacterium]|jgi:hypothetical protein